MRTFILLLLVAMVSCQKNDLNEICNVRNPTENIAWLKNKINELEADPNRKAFSISMGTLEGSTVFFINFCCSYCSYIVPIYDCVGIEKTGVNPGNVVNQKIVWKPADYSCL